MEAAQCRKKAIVISFASKDKEPLEVIEAACRIPARLISHLSNHWLPGVELYAVNISMIPGVDTCKAEYTTSLPGYWTQSSFFQEVDIYMRDQDQKKGEIREFKWRPQFKDVERAVSRAEKGTDGRAMVEGNIRYAFCCIT